VFVIKVKDFIIFFISMAKEKMSTREQ
jgi:hypothetical protein